MDIAASTSTRRRPDELTSLGGIEGKCDVRPVVVPVDPSWGGLRVVVSAVLVLQEERTAERDSPGATIRRCLANFEGNVLEIGTLCVIDVVTVSAKLLAVGEGEDVAVVVLDTQIILGCAHWFT